MQLIETERGTDNTCAHCGEPLGAEQYARNDDEARAGLVFDSPDHAEAYFAPDEPEETVEVEETAGDGGPEASEDSQEDATSDEEGEGEETPDAPEETAQDGAESVEEGGDPDPEDGPISPEDELKELIGNAPAAALRREGITSLAVARSLGRENLKAIDGIGDTTIEKILGA